jgi:hypothetical protein
VAIMKKFVGGVIGFLVGALIAFIVVASLVLVPRHSPYDVDAGYWVLMYYIAWGLPAGGIIGAVIGGVTGGGGGQGAEKRCPNCHRQVEASSSTCWYCGTEVK